MSDEDSRAESDESHVGPKCSKNIAHRCDPRGAPRRLCTQQTIAAMSAAARPPKEEGGSGKRSLGTKSQRAEKSKTYKETVVKCSLGGRVTFWMRAAIDGLVEDVSKAAHKASLVFNAMLLHCLDNGTPLPPLTKGFSSQNTFIHCFMVGDEIRVSSKFTPQVRAAWNAAFAPLQWPHVPRVKGDSNAYVAAAKTYQTNFVNSCVFAFEGRQKAHVRAWCGTAGSPFATDVTPILAAINGWVSTKPLPVLTGLDAFIATERAALGLAAGETPNEAWRADNLPKVVRYYHHILRAQEAHTAAATARQAVALALAEASGKDQVRIFFPRGFTLAPICDIKRHFVTIDKEVLGYLNATALALHRLAKVDADAKAAPSTGGKVDADAEAAPSIGDEEDADAVAAPFTDGKDVWGAFNFKGLRPSARPQDAASHLPEVERGAIVKSDGVSLCVHYHVYLSPAEQARKAATNTSAKRRRVAKADAVAAKASGQQSAPPLLEGQRVIAFDPGRRTLLYGVESMADGSLKKHALSRAAYYCGMGAPRADMRRRGWIANSEGAAAAHTALAAASPKTGSVAAFGAFLAVVRAHYDALWACKLPRKWGREALRGYRLKHRVMDRFFAGIKAATAGTVDPLGQQPFRIAYGAAKFSSTGNGGELSAPVSFQLKRAKLAFGEPHVCMEDEFCTTKCCAACGARGVTSILQSIFEPVLRVETVAAQQQRAAAAAVAGAGTGGGGSSSSAPPSPPPRKFRRRVLVRGLKRCSNTECRKFYDRDANAARNILAVHLARAAGKPRPHHLSRDSAANRGEPCSFLIVACNQAVTRSARAPQGGPGVYAVADTGLLG